MEDSDMTYAAEKNQLFGFLFSVVAFMANRKT